MEGQVIRLLQERTQAMAAATPKANTYRMLGLFGDVLERVRRDYVEPPDEKALMENAINGMLAALDPQQVLPLPRSTLQHVRNHCLPRPIPQTFPVLHHQPVVQVPNLDVQLGPAAILVQRLAILRDGRVVVPRLQRLVPFGDVVLGRMPGLEEHRGAGSDNQTDYRKQHDQESGINSLGHSQGLAFTLVFPGIRLGGASVIYTWQLPLPARR